MPFAKNLHFVSFLRASFQHFVVKGDAREEGSIERVAVAINIIPCKALDLSSNVPFQSFETKRACWHLCVITINSEHS